MLDEVHHQGTYQPAYVPAGLSQLELEVLVQARFGGYLLGTGVAGPEPIVRATRDAALTAARSMIDAGLIAADQIGRLLIEIEVIGAAVPFAVEGDWTRPRVAAPFVEPGVHGMVILGPRGRHRFTPSEVFTSDLVLPEALSRLARHTVGDSSAYANATLLRFRTTHWYEDPDRAEIVTLQRGLKVVPLAEVTPANLDRAIARLADYMAYRQLPTGLFSYQFEAGLDRYSEEDSLVRQIGAAAAMARHAARTGKGASKAAADMALRYHLQGFTDIPDVSEAAFIATADGKHPLGVTAMLAIAMALHPDAPRMTTPRRKLINGILWLQRPSGMFITAFPPAESVGGQEYYPGEAMLALAYEYKRQPSARILEAFARSIDYYRRMFRDRRRPAMIPWQMQAYALMAQATRRPDYRDFVFELADWLADRQITQSNNPWPELGGGIAAYQPGRADVGTASYLEGICDAISLAQNTGDSDRAARYRSVARRAARFVLQLEVKPEEAYFVRSRRDAIGGIRRTLTLNLLRISHCQHALMALMKTRDVLYPD